MKRIVVFLLVLSSCAPNSSKDFQHEGEARCRALVKELQKIESREQLLSQEAQLKKHFESLVDVMVAAREFEHTHPDDLSQDTEENDTELVLQEELRRIYAIEGGREVVERAQHEALIRLDGYEKARVKKNQKLK